MLGAKVRKWSQTTKGYKVLSHAECKTQLKKADRTKRTENPLSFQSCGDDPSAPSTIAL